MADTEEPVIEIDKYDDGSFYVTSKGKPIPCKIVVRDWDYDPYSVDDLDTIITDEDGDEHALVVYEKGTRIS